MKKLIAILIACFIPILAHAQAGAYVSFNWSGTAAANVALTSAVIDARELESLVIVGSVASTNRTIQVNCLSATNTAVTLFAFPAITVDATSATNKLIFMRPDVVVPSSAPTNSTYWNVSLCPRIQVVMASVDGTARLDIFGRRAQVMAKTQKVYYESGSVTAGAALTSGVINVSRAESYTVMVEATTTQRTLITSCVDYDGTQLFALPSATISAANKYLIQYRNDSPVPGSEPTNVVHVPLELCSYMVSKIAAAGAASAKLAVFTR